MEPTPYASLKLSYHLLCRVSFVAALMIVFLIVSAGPGHAVLMVTDLGEGGNADIDGPGGPLSDSFFNAVLPPVTDSASVGNGFSLATHSQNVASYSSTSSSLSLDVHLNSNAILDGGDFLSEASGNLSMDFTITTDATLSYTASTGPSGRVQLQKFNPGGGDIFNFENGDNGTDTINLVAGDYNLYLESFADGSGFVSDAEIDLEINEIALNTGVPEPSTLTLAALGFLAIIGRRRRN